MAPDDPFAVGRKEGAAIVAGLVGQAADARTVRLHDVDVAKPGCVFLVALALAGREFFQWKSPAQRAENDLLSVRRPRAFCVVPGRISQVNEIAAVLLRGKDVEGRVVIPGVAPLFPAGPKFELGLLFGDCLRVRMRRREKNVIRSRPKESAGGFTRARRDTSSVAGFEIKDVLLIKWISRIALALEDQLCSIRRKIPFAAPLSFEHQLSWVWEESLFRRGILRGGGARQHRDENGKEKSPHRTSSNSFPQRGRAKAAQSHRRPARNLRRTGRLRGTNPAQTGLPFCRQRVRFPRAFPADKRPRQLRSALAPSCAERIQPQASSRR